jgi:MerR family transcriptional regulator/heat shock protein HspR
MTGQNDPVYATSVAAKLCDMHPQTLRLYERLGLVKPQRQGNRRLYSDADIRRLLQIQRLSREMGVNLAGVEIILNLLEKIEQLQNQVASAHHFVERELEEMRATMEEELRRALTVQNKLVRIPKRLEAPKGIQEEVQ